MTSSIGRAGALRGAGVVALALGVLVPAAVMSPPAARGDDRAQTRRGLPDRTPSDVHQYQLRPVDDGTFLYDGDAFSAVIQPDGAVEFHPQHWKVRTSVGEAITNTGRGWQGKVWPVPLPSDYRPTPYDLRGQHLDPFTPMIPVAEPIFADPGGRFDLSDEYARRMGSDPYSDAKIAFLTDTFDFRMKLAARAHQQAVSAALDQLPDRLNEIWSDPGLTPPERRQIIYLLWQETTTDEVGTAARRIIAEFAEQNFPPGEAQRFQP